MGFLDESYATLLSPLRRPSPKEKEVGKCHSEDHDGRNNDRYFDIADYMERGLARELVADFMEPLPDASSLWKFCVQRSDDRQEYRLYCDGGEFLMYARASRDCRRLDIFLYDPKDKESTLFDPLRPAFTMAANAAKTEWRLTQERCDNCRHSPEQHATCCCCRGRVSELLRVRHSNVEVGDGVNHCMDVFVPVDDNYGYAREHRFITKMPVWNDKVECLVLDFKGRKILASAKNFQLASEADESERVVCQYGKLSTNSFGLDFRYPLTVVQAFGISLTTLFWA
jgi:hypothetical protein